MKTTITRLILGTTLVLGVWGCDDDDGGSPSDASADRTGDTAGDTRSDAVDTATPADTADAAAPDMASDTPAMEAGADAADGGDAAPVLTALETRGKYLVEAVIGCPDCHTPRVAGGALDATRYLAGDPTPAPMCLFANPARTECLFPRNLTNHETGLKNRSNDEIKRMIRDGIRPPATAGGAGEALHPIMPYYVFGNMVDADLDAIVAFLRTVPGVNQMIPRRGATFDIPAAVPKINLSNVPQPVAGYVDAAAANRGKYLATQTGLCIECHTPRPTAVPPTTALDETKFFQGGEDFTGILGPMVPIKSKNLTSDMVTGLGTWTLQQVITTMTEGKDKDGKGICPPMPSAKSGPNMMVGYGNLTAADAMDIAHYIKSLPAAVNMVADMCSLPLPM